MQLTFQYWLAIWGGFIISCIIIALSFIIWQILFEIMGRIRHYFSSRPKKEERLNEKLDELLDHVSNIERKLIIIKRDPIMNIKKGKD